MKILVTNDDGVTAPGLAALRAVAKNFGDVTVVAPDSHQSGASHAITLSGLTVRRTRVERDESFDAIAVEGRPADCVRVAILGLLDDPPDLVLSGINAGANVGIHVFYSGTVAAAAEAVMLGVPAVAFSLAVGSTPPDFRPAIETCSKVLARLIERGLSPSDLINVNLPERRAAKGIRIVRQSRARSRDRYRLSNASEREEYLIKGGGFHAPSRDTDIALLSKGYLTITPLHVDRTAHDKLDEWNGDHWADLLG